MQEDKDQSKADFKVASGSGAKSHLKRAYQHAAILSFLLPGAGQLYQGRTYRGLLFFSLFAASFVFSEPLFTVALFVAFAAALECFRGPAPVELSRYPRRLVIYLAASFLAFLCWFLGLGGEWLFMKPAAADAPALPLQTELVDLAKVDFTIQVGMVFAGKDNLAGKPLLPENRCIVRRPIAIALARAQETLKLRGLSLKVLDCYRPLSLETKFLEWIPKPHASAFKSQNNPFYRGAAVDVWLVQTDGQTVSLPGSYEWSAKVRGNRGRALTGASLRKAKSNQQVLTQAMRHEGFVPDADAWWRFRYNTWEQFPPSDLPFSEIP